MPVDESVPWTVVVPVKRLALAKTRLAGYGESGRARLALAFAVDVVTAAVGCAAVARVVVVTDDPQAAASLSSSGASVEPDGGTKGLNAVLVAAAGRVRARDGDVGVAVLPADLPALRSEDLSAALRAVGRGRLGFVADSEGSGTTLLAAASGCDLAAAYGPESRRRHLEAAAVELDAAPGLRRDVDTASHLRDARALGVGASTAAALAELA